MMVSWVIHPLLRGVAAPGGRKARLSLSPLALFCANCHIFPDSPLLRFRVDDFTFFDVEVHFFC